MISSRPLFGTFSVQLLTRTCTLTPPFADRTAHGADIDGSRGRRCGKKNSSVLKIPSKIKIFTPRPTDQCTSLFLSLSLSLPSLSFLFRFRFRRRRLPLSCRPPTLLLPLAPSNRHQPTPEPFFFSYIARLFALLPASLSKLSLRRQSIRSSFSPSSPFPATLPP